MPLQDESAPLVETIHQAAGPVVAGSGVTFRFPDPEHRLSAVWLRQEVAWPRSGPELSRVDGGWEAALERPAVDRMEYLFEVADGAGSSDLVCDPGNPLRAAGPFGDKSVVEFPEYRRPEWVEVAEAGGFPTGTAADLAIRVPSLGRDQPVRMWAPAGTDPDEPLPLLVVHDGVEYDELSGLTRFLAFAVDTGLLPPARAALLHPTERDAQYSASPVYSDALAKELLPELAKLAPAAAGRRFRVGMGASLGALAMLHAHRSEPAAFGALFLQSGSFFHHRYFRHELTFEHVDRIRRFMDRVHPAGDVSWAVPVSLTCGKVEMNLASNRALALAMRRQGYDVALTEVRDAHNWTAWRDVWTPHLVDLLQKVWT